MIALIFATFLVTQPRFDALPFVWARTWSNRADRRDRKKRKQPLNVW